MSFNTITSIFRNDDSGSYTPLPTFSTQTSEKEPSSPPSESSSQFSSAYSTSSRGQIDPRTVSDVTLGLSDGLTVPFALTAGLAALGDTKIVVFAGMAEILAGSISMGIGGYLGASGEATRATTIAMVHTSPAEARAAVISTLECYVSAALLDVVADDITASHDKTIAFLLEHQHRIDSADVSPRLYTSALCIAFGYFFGGLIPLLPYVFIADGGIALICSVVVMVFTLFGFGVGKTALLGERSVRARTYEGLKMVGLGGSAAAASVLCVRLVHY
ncbi:DUF125-domain-containing protein [Aureobasidium sp. EXF-12298]|nr:DUF125-domain-containing protein [Aureobasidium sp. EXF-12298]